MSISTNIATGKAAGDPASPGARPRPTTAADVMNASPRTCSKFSTVTEAVLIFKAEDCGLVPIVDEGRPIGVVTDRDIALGLAEHPDLAARPVADVMTANPVTVRADTPLNVVAKTLANARVRRLLVVDGDGRLAGVIAWYDVAPFLNDREVGDIVTETLGQT
jgi:CBS domain-containing protein